MPLVGRFFLLDAVRILQLPFVVVAHVVHVAAFALRGFLTAYLAPILRRIAVRSAGVFALRMASQSATGFGSLIAPSRG
ncbi:MAG: hypothetical protein ACREDH_05410 [Methylocella sp.]